MEERTGLPIPPSNTGAAEPEHDDRKLMGVKAILTLSALSAGLYYMKRLKWSALKTRQVAFREGGKF